MTPDYLVGELSARLERLQAVSAGAAAADLARLRRRVGTRPVFGICARLLEDG